MSDDDEFLDIDPDEMPLLASFLANVALQSPEHGYAFLDTLTEAGQYELLREITIFTERHGMQHTLFASARRYLHAKEN